MADEPTRSTAQLISVVVDEPLRLSKASPVTSNGSVCTRLTQTSRP